MKKITDNIYFIGVVNPNLRIFDIIMETKYGTTYNSFLVKGDKVALVETAHDTFSEAYLENILEVTSIEFVDYIIMNHTEPDHAGSIKKILEINPNITVVATAAGIKNIKNITNIEFNSMTVKTGDKLDIGQELVFEFITSPNLHWPDSMFAYLPKEKAVFTCDFLGAHYAETLIFDDKVTYPEKYQEAFLGYYTAIFSPFKKFVLDGLDRLEKLDFEVVCCSHGPVLRKTIKQAMQLYRKWSTIEPVEKNIAIFYVSAYGYTKMMAEKFEKELNLAGVPTKSYNIIETETHVLMEAMEKASSIMLGSPTINKDALKPVWDLISSIDAVSLRCKSCFVFGSYGWSGEACNMLQNRVKDLGFNVPIDFFRVVFQPNEQDYLKIKEIANDFAASI